MKEQAVLDKAGKLIQDEMRKQLRDQGHYLTGSLERSIVNRVVITGDATVLEGVALNYAGILDQGTTAARIPFSYGVTRPKGQGAGTSKYITALIQYWKLRGLDDKEAKSAAFATAIKQKREGMPTLTSRKHAKGGVRTFFIEVAEIALGRKVDDTVMGGIDDLIEKKFNETKSETI